MDPTAQNTPSGDSHMTMRYGESAFSNFKSKIPSILGWFMVFIAGAFVWSWVSSPMVVVVEGQGEVEVAANSAILSYSVVGRGADPQSAIADVNAKVASSQTALSGVASDDISKSQVQVVPQTIGGGYQAVVTVAAKTVNVGALESLISGLYAAGAVNVSQPILGVDEPEEFEKQAFDAAVLDAKQKAGEIGRENFKFIRKRTGISQTSSSSTSTATKGADVSLEAENPELVASGVFKIVKRVNVTYKMW